MPLMESKVIHISKMRRSRQRGFTLLEIMVVIVILGLLIHEGLIDLPQWISWPLLAIGLIEVFVTPQILARMWRTPPE